jgi:hypothetical protein
MYEQFPCSLDGELVDKEQSYGWLKFRDIKGEIGSTVVAAQDQALSTNYFKKILREDIKSKCRLCKNTKSTDHLTGVCPILTQNDYIIRHGKICTHLHHSICRKLGIETTENWYKHVLKAVCEHAGVTVLWN